MDVIVIPSEWEAPSIVLLEAMAAARPVIAFAVGGIPEAVVPGETGILVPHCDVAALSSQVLALLHDPARRRRMGAAARRHVEMHFSLRTSAEQFLRLYGQLISGYLPRNSA